MADVHQKWNGVEQVEVPASGEIQATDHNTDYVLHANPSDVSNYGREGNDLILTMRDGGTLRIKDFFEHGLDFNHLVFANGEQVAIDGQPGVTGTQAVYADFAAGDSNSGSLLPILAALVLGGAAIGALSSGGGGSSAPPSTPGNLQVVDTNHNDMPVASGTADKGNTVTVTWHDGTTSTATVDQDGNWSVPASATQTTGPITVVAHDPSGHQSAPATVIYTDVTPPGYTAQISQLLDDVGSITGPVASGGYTDDKRPQVSGTVANHQAGDLVNIYDGTTLLGSTAVNADGTWSFTPTTDLADAQHTLTTKVVDAAGNIGPASDPWVFTVDTIPPTNSAVTLTAIQDDTGISSTDFITSDNTLVIVATATTLTGGPLPADEKVQISTDAGVTWHDATLQSDGTWAYDNTGTKLPDNQYTFQARIVDAAGNVGSLNSKLVIIDTTSVHVSGQSSIAITKYFDDLVPQTGDFDSGTSTNDTSPLLKGTVDAKNADGSAAKTDGDVVQVFEGATLVGSAVVVGGSWNLQLKNVSEGPHSYTAALYDVAGNPVLIDNADGTSKALVSTAFSLTVDLTPPGDGALKVDGVYDNVPPVTGLIAENALTDDSKPEYRGTATVGDVVKVEVFDTINGNTVSLGITTVNADGTWSFTPAVRLGDGPHSLTAQPIDAAGLTGKVSAASDFLVAGVAPSAPQVLSIMDDVGSVQGPVDKGQSTDDPTLTVNGTADGAGTVVTVFVDGTANGSAVVDGNGHWSVVTNITQDGSHTITAQATDGAGQVSPTTGPWVVVLDTQAPDKPAVPGATDDFGSQTGPITPGSTTDDNTPTLSGSGTPGDVVTIYDISGGGTPTQIGSTTIPPSGSWIWTPDTPLGEGPHTLTTTETDPAGNTSKPSDPLNVTVDTSKVTVSINNALDDAGSITGSISGNGVTDDTTPTLVGTATPGALVTVSVQGSTTPLGSVTADSLGDWRLDLPTQGEGSHTYVATAQNAAGTNGTASFTLTVDTTPPAAPATPAANDDVGLRQGPLKDGDSTDDSTPTLSGSGATPGDVIKVYDNGDLLGSVQVDPKGNWVYTPIATLPEGEHALTATATDPAGNESKPSPAINLTVDVTPPTATATISAIVDDSGIANDFYTNDTTLLVNATVNGTLDKGDTVQISIDKGATWNDAKLLSGNTWQYDATGTTLKDGDYTFESRVIDVAGNFGKATSQVVTIDTIPPPNTGSVSITGFVDDVGPVTNDNFPSGTTTDDATPLLKGTSKDLIAGSYIAVTEGGKQLGDLTKVAADGSWSLQLPTQGEGQHTYIAVVSDESGNTNTTVSTPFTLTVDTIPPPPTTLAKISAIADDNGTPGDFITNDQTLLVSATVTTASGTTLDQGDKVEISLDNGTTWHDAKLLSGNTWQYDATGTTLAEGNYTFQARVADAAGNTGTATSQAVRIDLTSSHGTATITGFADDVAPVTNDNFPSGTTTDDATPLLKGATKNVDVGDFVNVFEGANSVGTAQVASDGSWTLQLTTQKDGEHSYTAVISDAAGNTGTASTPFTLTVDTAHPTGTATITGFADDFGTVTNDNFPSGTITDDTTPLLKGSSSGLVSGDFVKVFDGSTELGSTTVVTGGSWSLQLATQKEGAHSYTAQVFDGAGNSGTASGPFTLTVKTTSPPPLTDLHLTDNVGAITGEISQGGVTDDQRPVYTGKADATQVTTVEVFDTYKGVTTELGTTAVTSGGTWSFKPVTPLGGGDHIFIAKPVDVAGNTGDATANWNFTESVVPPTEPQVLGVTDDIGSVRGQVDKGQVTDDPKLTVNGTADAGTVVTVFVDGTANGSALVDSNRNWSVETSMTQDGPHTITAQASNVAGQTSTTTGPWGVVLDTQAPPQPAVPTATDNVSANGSPTGPIANGGSTDDSTPTFGGSGTAGDVITIYDGATPIGSTTVAGNGTWSWTPSTSLATPTSSHSITTTETDPAGNTSVASNPLTFNVDTGGVTVRIINAQDDFGSITGAIASGGATDDTTPTLVGTTTVLGGVVTVYLQGNATPLGSATADAQGSWHLELPAQGEGQHIYVASVQNAAGTTDTDTITLTIDKTPPSVPAIGSVNDDVGLVQGDLKNGDSTDDSTPTLHGSGATPGDVITVYDGNAPLGSTTVGQDGSWVYTPQAALSESSHALTATATDPVGNESAKSPAFNLTVDKTPPTATAAISAIADDTGTSATDFVTTDNTLVVSAKVASGTLATGDKVQISLGDGIWHDATPGTGGVYTYDATGGTPLTEGSHTFLARVVDAAGNAGSATPQTVIIDTSPPLGTAAITAYTDNEGPKTGDFFDGSSTDDTTPLLKGTSSGLVAGDIVKVFEGTNEIGSTTVVGGGSWNLQLSTQSEGAHHYTATVYDAAGNSGTASAAFTLTVLTTQPTALPEGAMNLLDDVPPITGTIKPGDLTDDQRPTYSGTADPSQVAAVEVFDNYNGANTSLGSTTVKADGTWSFTPTLPLGAGDHSFTAQPINAAGIAGPATSGWAFKESVTPPHEPVISDVTDNVPAQLGHVEKGALTNDPTLTITGTADPSVTEVVLKVDGVVDGSTAVDSSGHWSIDTKSMADGDHAISAMATNAAGQTSTTTGDWAFTVDTKAPSQPAVPSGTDNVQPETGPIVNGSQINDTKPVLSGSGEVGSTITIYDGATQIGTATVQPNGKWSFTLTNPLALGDHSITTTETDPAGNTSVASDPLKFTIVDPPPGVFIDAAHDDVGSITADVASGGSTDDTTPTLVGRATAGDIVTLSVQGSSGSTQALGTAVADSTGHWSYTLPAQGEGQHTYTASVQNAAGTKTDTFTLTVDTTAPATPTIGSVKDDVGTKQGPLNSGDSTDDPTPTLSDKGTSGDVITIYDNDKPIGSTTVGADGTWTFTPSAFLPEGTHALTATATDPVGNTSPKSPVFNLTEDRTPPTTTATISAIADDTGTSATDFVTTDNTLVISVTPSGTLGAGDVVQISLGDGKWLDATPPTTGSVWQYDATGTTLKDGVYTFQTQVVDAAGNAGTPTSQTVIIDTTPSTGSVSISAYTDDVTPLTGDFQSGSTTNDTTPLLTGVASGLVAGDIIKVYDGSIELGSTTAVGGGSWSLQLATQGEGGHSYTAVIFDAAGNSGAASAAFTLTVKTSPPPSLSNLHLIDDFGTVTGDISQGGTTDDQHPEYTGTADATQVTTVEVFDTYLGVTTELGTTAVTTGGTWSFTPVTPLGGGDHSFTAMPIDAAGNTGTVTTPWNFTESVVPPSEPQVLGVTDDIGSVRGPVDKGQVTDDTTLTVNGTADPGNVVTLMVDGKGVGSALVDGTGHWSIDTTAASMTPDGPHAITALASNAAGQTSTTTGPWNVVLDTQAPPQPAVPSATDDFAPITGPISNGGTTNDVTPTFSGSGTAGDVITIYDGANVIGSTTVGGSGTWSWTPSTPLATPTSSHSITTTETDPAGNASAHSNPLNFTVDTTSVALNIINAQDDVGSITGNIANGGSTDDTTPTLTGTATPGALVTVSDQGGTTPLGSATADAQGNWHLDLPTQGEGPHTYVATTQNTAGTPATAQFTLTVDTTAPKPPTIDSVNDDVGLVQGDLKNGDPTDDSTPTLHGSGATPGDIIKIYDDGALHGSVQVDSSGNWVYTPVATLSQGAHTLTATATDPVGNESQPSAPFSLTVDTIPPTSTATISAITDDTGTPGDFKTSDNTLVVSASITSGTLDASDKVQISIDGGNSWHDATLPATTGGVWQYDATSTTLADGNYIFEARVVDAAGNYNVGPSQTVTIDKNGISTATLTVTGIVDDVPPVTGTITSSSPSYVNGIYYTNDTSPQLQGSVDNLSAGDQIRVFENGTQLGTATVTGGSWSYDLSGVTEGTAHTYTVTVYNTIGTAGNSASLTLEVDGTPPPAPTVDDLVDDEVPVTGTITPGTLTNDTTPTYSGHADATQVTAVEVLDTVNGVTTSLGTTKVNADGSWSFTPGVPLAGDTGAGIPHSFVARSVDAAGNTSAETTPWAFNVVGGGLPNPPQIATVIDDVGSVTGKVEKGSSTDDKTLTVSGTSDSGTYVTVMVDGVSIGTTSVDGQGKWTIETPLGSTDQSYDITAKATDGAGRDSPTTGAWNVVLDTTAPDKPAVPGANDDAGNQTGPIKGGDTTDDSTPTFSGSGTAGDVVTIYDGATALGSTTVGGSGTWSWTPPNPLKDAPYSITTTETDPAGNASAHSDPLAFNIDTSSVTVSITKATDDAGSITGDVAKGGATDDTTPTLVGTASGGALVTITDSTGTPIGSATADTGGNWSVTLPTQIEGDHTYTATAKNAAGTTGTDSFNLTIDLTPPKVPDTPTVNDDVGLKQGNLKDGDTTDDPLPTLSGTGTAGDTINIYDGSKLLVAGVPVKSDGTWGITLPSPGLAEGPHALAVSEVDPVGNESAKSTPINITVDLTPPDALANITSIDDDNGPSKTDMITNDNTLVLHPTITKGTLDAGDAVQVSLDNGTSWTTIVPDSSGVYSYDITGTPLKDGTYTYLTHVIDAAGNAGVVSSQVITIDTTQPSTPAVPSALDDVNNAAPSTNPQFTATGPIAPNTTTDDAWPEFSGTGTDGVASAGSIITIYDSVAGGAATVLGSTTVKADGTWTFTPDADHRLLGSTDNGYPTANDQPPGPTKHSITVMETDLAGNDSPHSAALNFTVDSNISAGSVSLSMISTAANDSISIPIDGRNQIQYFPIAPNANDPTGGNTVGTGTDHVNGFHVGDWFDASSTATGIYLSKLIIGTGNIPDYVSSQQTGGSTVLYIDRDGTGSVYSPTPLLTLVDTLTTVDELVKNHQIF